MPRSDIFPTDPVKDYVLKTDRVTPSLRIDYEKELNSEQLAAVMAPVGPVLVIAGAGSGKTRVVTYRVARLIEQGIQPARILLVTFTNKAAREMVRRVELLLGLDAREIWAGTFHHVGHRILRRHGSLLGYSDRFSILDREDARSILDDCVDEMNLRDLGARFPKADILADILSFAANTCQPIAKAIATRFLYHASLSEEIEKVAVRYQLRKKAQSLVDFDDLLAGWKQLHEDHPELCERYGEQFVQILVDEYQDTNRLQGILIDQLSRKHRNLMVVGDDSQSIYAFRGAHFANIIEFPKRYPDAKMFKLESNYRSTPEILRLANASIRHNRRQFPKVLRARKPEGPLPAVVPVVDETEQARFLMQRIRELGREGTALGEIAVLYRAHHQSMALQMELTRAGIPYQVRSGLRFFEQAHIKDVTSYLRLIANPRDELAWKRSVKLYPKIGNQTAGRIWNALSESPDPLEAAGSEAFYGVLPRGAAKSWEKFLGTLERLKAPAVRDPSSSSGPAEMIRLVLDGGYREYLEDNFENAAEREEDVVQLANYAQGFSSVEEFLGELALLTSVSEQQSVLEEKEKDQLILSTVHQAKGLEWTVVFVIGLVDGRFPDARSFREPGAEEEERRLFYVAITRARQGLYLTFPEVAREAGLQVVQRRSRFLKELERKTYEECRVRYATARDEDQNGELDWDEED